MIKLKSLLQEGSREDLAVDYLKKLIDGTEFENKVFIAGGAVRDELMGKPIKDIDLVVDMPDGGIKFADWATKQMGNYKEGSNPVVYPTYGTAKFNLRRVNHGGEDLSDIEIETVAPRSEEYEEGLEEIQNAIVRMQAQGMDFRKKSVQEPEITLETEEEIQAVEVVQQIDLIIDCILELSFVKSLLNKVSEKHFCDIVAYGIGPLSKSPKARVQFALAEIIKRRLNKEKNIMEAWYASFVITIEI